VKNRNSPDTLLDLIGDSQQIENYRFKKKIQNNNNKSPIDYILKYIELAYQVI